MKLRVNGVERGVDADWQNENLLVVLREQLGLSGSRYGCGIGQCGACVVHVDGAPLASCMMPVTQAADKDILTIEGLAAPDGALHPLQQAWIDENVPQCGYCQSGQIMQAASLLRGNPSPTDEEIEQSMRGNMCRCMTYTRINAAVRTAANGDGTGGGRALGTCEFHTFNLFFRSRSRPSAGRRSRARCCAAARDRLPGPSTV